MKYKRIILNILDEGPATYKQLFEEQSYGFACNQKEFNADLMDLMESRQIAYNTSAREYSLIR